MSTTSEQVAAGYDQIADRWLDVSTYGFAQIERAVAFVEHMGAALDVGCGTGRLSPRPAAGSSWPPSWPWPLSGRPGDGGTPCLA